MSLFSLADRVAVITGSTRGIGRAIAERMAEAGARVVVSSRKRDACDEVVAAIEAAHGRGRAIAIPANISSKDELRNLVDETTKRLGRIDVLVCNAASNPYYGPMAGLDDEHPPFVGPTGFSGDPFGTFTIGTTGVYTVAVGGADSTDGGVYPYRITMTAAPIAAVPEPSTYLMMAVGLAGVGWLRRRKARPTS